MPRWTGYYAAVEGRQPRTLLALLPGGRFAGQFLGVNDTWAHEPSITALEEGQLCEMLIGLDVERFETEERDGVAVSGPKHWHLFHVVARQPGASTAPAEPSSRSEI